MKYRLIDVASVIRSKNAGPYELCFDIIFKEEIFYTSAKKQKIISHDSFAKLFNIDPSAILNLVYFDPAKAIKITIERPLISGSLGEKDVYGAQQHRPLITFEFFLPKD